MNPKFPSVAIIIPAFNEASSIYDTVRAAAVYGKVVVVNDNSKDSTAALAINAGAVVVNQKTNMGYDQALNSGFAAVASNGIEWAITFDADGQHPADAIPKFVEEFEKGAQLVVGVRPSYQRLAEMFFSFYTRIRFGVRDPLCGMKGYSLGFYRELGQFDSVNSTGTEMMIRMCLSRVRLSQVKISINDRADAPRFGWGWSANKRILKSLFAVIAIDLRSIWNSV
ncbi:glycosyltransferase family 2 protein [Bdellovibrio sp. HCB2-146]|uniref:glycosyltransferase family 2 protein n=1 Tax=Bdellovibrio sp. HCB2-146 TaxID=3394362 RepID=UPI0039BD0E09